ncbi:two-component system cell cycle sensor histidine kinase PleC [Kaistia hirudinis]|uniref:histidine kinase n=1 Tax=Kaistia hirudinis TaxID=1293440 RepID=A0A840AJW9_9HYPH|nr:HAMP domain-containing sensor histidine kinase [Kaistia hirudinis]MBB3929444.1 two-component system cell cycle sensor histidine kinase PleC [Kaistia hirudinis]MBN9018532.1 HAMP domain-containing histidine kinase [Hyphomicrobiales bacterium]
MQAGPATTAEDKSTMNHERAERRRAAARTVRDLRERLTSAGGTSPAFDQELLRHYAGIRLSAVYAVPLLVVLVALVATVWLKPIPIAIWAVVTLLVHATGAWLCRRFLRSTAERGDVKRWTRIFVASEFFYGLTWIGLLLATSVVHAPGIEIFQFATMLTILAVGTMFASSLPAGAVAGTAPIALTMVALFALRQDVLYLALSFLSIGSEIFFLTLSQRLQSATVGMMRYRAEKDLLIAELGTEKAISDEARRRAEEANLAKSRFLATMSHELRTPLNAILGFSEVMKNEVLGPMQNATYREYAGDVHASGQHLLDLINEILDLSRIEAGRYELNEEPVTLVHVVEDCENLMRLRAGKKDLSITRKVEPDLPRIWADERAVRQIVLNLLSNAIKFTQSGGEIEIRVGWTAGGGEYVSVRDNGPGIPEEEIPIVLSAFGQGAIAIKSAEQGTGLGLPIVQAMMEMHDGTFELRSKLREGTEAIACFPRSRVMEPLAPILEDDAKPRSRWRKTA